MVNAMRSDTAGGATMPFDPPLINPPRFDLPSLRATMIAARSRGLIDAEVAHAAARSRRADLRDDARLAARRARGSGAPSAEAARELAQIEAKIALADQHVASARTRLDAEREKCSPAFAKAVAPVRHAAVREIAEALARIEAAEGALAQISDFAARTGLREPFGYLRQVGAEDVARACRKIIEPKP